MAVAMAAGGERRSVTRQADDVTSCSRLGSKRWLMKSPLSLRAMTAVAAVLGYSLIVPDAGNAQGAALGQGSSGNYELLTPQGAGPFPAVIGMHPCNGLILIGRPGDWPPASRCLGGAGANLKVYRGATHAFDAPRADRTYLGHHLSYDAAATADAIDRTQRFLSSRLGR